MVDVVLLLWVWVLAGCFALYAHSASLAKDIDLGSVFFLVMTWPWWLTQSARRGNDQRTDTHQNFAKVRIDETDKKQRRR